MDNYFAISDHMLSLPASAPNPLDFEWLRDTQEAAMILKRNCEENVPGFSLRSFEGVKLVCFTEKGKE